MNVSSPANAEIEKIRMEAQEAVRLMRQRKPILDQDSIDPGCVKTRSMI